VGTVLLIEAEIHIDLLARGNTAPLCIDTPAVQGCDGLRENDMEGSAQGIPFSVIEMRV
jgi:hypothetical protein